MIDKEYNKILKQYHKLSNRHILVVETDMPYSDVFKVVLLSDKIRKAGNELVRLMRKNYDQLLRTKNINQVLELPKEELGRLFFKISFHYKELVRINQLDRFFENVKNIHNAGASFTLELMAYDGIESEIENIKDKMF